MRAYCGTRIIPSPTPASAIPSARPRCSSKRAVIILEYPTGICTEANKPWIANNSISRTTDAVSSESAAVLSANSTIRGSITTRIP